MSGMNMLFIEGALGSTREVRVARRLARYHIALEAFCRSASTTFLLAAMVSSMLMMVASTGRGSVQRLTGRRYYAIARLAVYALRWSARSSSWMRG